MWMKTMRLAAAFAVGAVSVLAISGPVRADDRDELVTLYKIAISADACNFALSDDQADAVGSAMDALIGKMNLSDDDADKLYLETESEMEAADWDKVCDPNGAWAKSYGGLVAKYGG